MTIEQRQKIAEKIFAECKEVLLKKGRDYSGEDDALANFKVNAERWGLSKYQVWAIYFSKHINSIENSIKLSPTKPQMESEPIRGRIVDIINYAIILEALLEEDR